MLQALEGSMAIARTVALCRPQVVAAYPITPQTHIVENNQGEHGTAPEFTLVRFLGEPQAGI